MREKERETGKGKERKGKRERKRGSRRLFLWKPSSFITSLVSIRFCSLAIYNYTIIWKQRPYFILVLPQFSSFSPLDYLLRSSSATFASRSSTGLRISQVSFSLVEYSESRGKNRGSQRTVYFLRLIFLSVLGPAQWHYASSYWNYFSFHKIILINIYKILTISDYPDKMVKIVSIFLVWIH